MKSHKKTLVIGFGNLDRADDGVAFHVVNECRRRLGRPPLEEEETGLDELGGLRDSVFVGQLTPEMMDLVLGYDRIIFVDAHIDPALGNLHCSAVDPDDAGLTFTHSMTPATLLAFVKALHGRDLEGRLISIYGHNFDFQRNLSPETETLVEGAADLVSSL